MSTKRSLQTTDNRFNAIRTSPFITALVLIAKAYSSITLFEDTAATTGGHNIYGIQVKYRFSRIRSVATNLINSDLADFAAL